MVLSIFMEGLLQHLFTRKKIIGDIVFQARSQQDLAPAKFSCRPIRGVVVLGPNLIGHYLKKLFSKCRQYSKMVNKAK